MPELRSIGPATPVSPQHGPPAAKLLLPALVLASVLGIGASNILVPAIPAMAQSLGAPITAVQATFAIYLTAFAAGMLVLGPLSDRYGRRRLLLIGTALCAAGSIAGALCPSVEWLLVARIVQGIGACAGTVVARAVIADIYGRERAAQVLAGLALTVTSAQMLAPWLGGHIEEAIGWRASFVVIAICSSSAFVLAGCAVGRNIGRRSTDGSIRVVGQTYLRLLRTRRFAAYAIIAAGAHAGSHAFAVGAPALLINRFLLTPAQCGLCAGLSPVGFMIGSLLSRHYVNRVGADRLISIGLILLIQAGALMTALAFARCANAATLVGPMILISAASGLITPNAIAATLSAEGDRLRGLAAGLTTFLQIAGGIIATTFLALLPGAGPRTLSLIIASGGSLSLIGCLWLRSAGLDGSRLLSIPSR